MLEHPERILSNSDLAAIAKSMHEKLDAQEVTESAFLYAAREAGTFCKYFPKPADIMQYVEQYRRNPPPSDCLQLPEKTELTSEEIKANMKNFEICRRAARGEITWAEATDMLEKMVGN